MKLIAVNIFDFTSWYKFGYKSVFKAQIIDTDDIISNNDLIHKIGFYEEDYELLFLELDPVITFENSEVIQINLNDVISIKPLTKEGGRILSGKIPDFNISDAVDLRISNIISSNRNKHIAIQGGERLCKSFLIDPKPLFEKYSSPFLIALEKYFSDLNSNQDTVLDNLLFYERAKPYPLLDIGYLFDVGAIARNRFNLTDDDFKQIEILKESDFDKYELVQEILAFSKYLQENKNNEKGTWSNFINEIRNSEWLGKLNNDLCLISSDSSYEINNFLIIAFFLKFRYLIRNTTNLEGYQFKNAINQHIENRPIESSISLFLVGMFFGGLKFKEIFYKSSPLKIMKLANYENPLQVIKKIENKENEVEIIQKVNSQQGDNSNVVYENPDNNSIADISLKFNEMFWSIVENKIIVYSKEQRKIIKGCFDFALKGDDNALFSSRHVYFINLLKKKAKSAKEKTAIDKKLNQEIIDDIQNFLLSYFPND